MTTVPGQIQKLAPVAAAMVCIGLAALIWLPLGNADPQGIPATPNTDTDATERGSADVLATGAQSLVERPLFHVTRRPPAIEPTVEAVPVQVTLSLTGVVNNGDVDIALLSLSNSPELLRLRVGDHAGDWQILDITKTAVTVLTPDGQEQVIGLSSSN